MVRALRHLGLWVDQRPLTRLLQIVVGPLASLAHRHGSPEAVAASFSVGGSFSYARAAGGLTALHIACSGWDEAALKLLEASSYALCAPLQLAGTGVYVCASVRIATPAAAPAAATTAI